MVSFNRACVCPGVTSVVVLLFIYVLVPKLTCGVGRGKPVLEFVIYKLYVVLSCLSKVWCIPFLLSCYICTHGSRPDGGGGGGGGGRCTGPISAEQGVGGGGEGEAAARCPSQYF